MLRGRALVAACGARVLLGRAEHTLASGPYARRTAVAAFAISETIETSSTALVDALSQRGYRCSMSGVREGSTTRGSVLCVRDPLRHRSQALVYPYGALVFFGASPEFKLECTALVQALAARGVFARPAADEMTVVEAPLSTSFSLSPGGEVLSLPQLDRPCANTIGAVLGQSTALRKVESMVNTRLGVVSELNASVLSSGQLLMSSAQLFRFVAENNASFLHLISRLRIAEADPSTWVYGPYERLHRALLGGYDMIGRFDVLDGKYRLVRERSQNYVEGLRTQASHVFKWLFIFVFALESTLWGLSLVHDRRMRRLRASTRERLGAAATSASASASTGANEASRAGELSPA